MEKKMKKAMKMGAAVFLNNLSREVGEVMSSRPQKENQAVGAMLCGVDWGEVLSSKREDIPEVFKRAGRASEMEVSIRTKAARAAVILADAAGEAFWATKVGKGVATYFRDPIGVMSGAFKQAADNVSQETLEAFFEGVAQGIMQMVPAHTSGCRVRVQMNFAKGFAQAHEEEHKRVGMFQQKVASILSGRGSHMLELMCDIRAAINSSDKDVAEGISFLSRIHRVLPVARKSHPASRRRILAILFTRFCLPVLR